MTIRSRLKRLLKRPPRRGSRGAKRSFAATASAGAEVLESRALLSGNSLDSIPQLNSLPEAPVTLYLDFDGHTEVSDWNSGNPFTTPAYDIDNDKTTFNDEELSRIEQIWNLVAEDYRPFNVNVTTVDPGSFENFEGVLVSIGGDGAWAGGGGGIAFVNSFSNSRSNTVFVFSDTQQNGNASFTGFTASHESAHAFGLVHHSQFDADGNKINEYEPGDFRQGPLLGSAFTAERNTWTVGPSNTTVTTIQDDLAVLTRPANQTFRYRDDDFGSDVSTATDVSITDGAFQIDGVIERNEDSDFFSVTANAGQFQLDAKGLDLRTEFGGSVIGSNLDIVLRIYDQTGTLIQESDSSNSLNGSLALLVPDDGTAYFVEVANTGEYGALGQYTLTGTQLANPIVTAPNGLQETVFPEFQWLPSLRTESYSIEVERISDGVLVLQESGITANTFKANVALEQVDYRVRITGDNTEFSEWLNFTVEVPTPGKPVIVSPAADTIAENPVVTFDWEDVSYASTYEVLLRNLRTNELTTLTEDVRVSNFTVSEALPDDPYRVWVRATNEANETGEWSEDHDFEVDLPTPDRAVVTAPIGTVRDTQRTITWDAVQHASYYQLWVNGPTQSQLIIERNLTDNSYDIPFELSEGRHRVWVRAFNANDETLGWSSRYTFTVDVPVPVRPVIQGPSGVVDTNSPTILWTDTDPYAVQWELWVNSVTEQKARVIHETNLNTNEFDVVWTEANPRLLPDGEYNLWVRATNSQGETGPWSSRFEFEIDAPPAGAINDLTVPSVVNSVTVDRTPLVDWTDDSDSWTYDVQLDNLTTGENAVAFHREVSASDFTLAALNDGDEYRVRVRGVSYSGETGPWTEKITFQFEAAAAPAIPEILSPQGDVDNRGDAVSEVTIVWSNSVNTERFQLFVRDLTTNESKSMVIPADQTGSVFRYTFPLDGGNYRAWVRAINSSDAASLWSSPVDFSVLV